MSWLKPDGTPFAFRLQVEGDAIPTLARAGTIIAQQWQQQGIDVKVEVAGPTNGRRLTTGDFDTAIFWSIETWGGNPDLSFFLESYQSQFIRPLGQVQAPRNLQRWQDPELDKLVEANRKVPFNSPEVPKVGEQFLKLAVEQMPMIPLMAYNKFAPFDTTYWTGYPTVGKSLFGVGAELVEPALHDRAREAQSRRAEELGYRRHSSSLRGAPATKQSSSCLMLSGLLRFARNDGARRIESAS